jgi:hypothetical protein
MALMPCMRLRQPKRLLQHRLLPHQLQQPPLPHLRLLANNR